MYDGHVRYAKDAFEGLRLMDKIMARKAGGVELVDPEEEAKAAERKARRERSLRIAEKRKAEQAEQPEEELPARSDVATDVKISAGSAR